MIVVKSQLGRIAGLKGFTQFGLDKTGGVIQRIYTGGQTLFSTEAGNVYLGGTGIFGNIYFGDRKFGSHPGIFDDPPDDERADLFSYFCCDSARSNVGHTNSSPQLFEGFGDFPGFIHLELVPDFQIVEVFDADSAFVSGFYLAGIFLEAFERGYLSGIDLNAVANNMHH